MAVSKYNITVSGAATSFTVTHSLGTTAVVVSVVNNATGDAVIVDWSVATSNTITVNFATEPGAKVYSVTVIG